jgi:large subunit ribosomal protein L27
MGKDHTIFAKIEGFVKFDNVNKNKKRVSVIPA